MSDNLKDLIPEGHEIVTDDDDLEGFDDVFKKAYKEIMDDYDKSLDEIQKEIDEEMEAGNYDTGDPELDPLYEIVDAKPTSEWGKKESDAWNKILYILDKRDEEAYKKWMTEGWPE